MPHESLCFYWKFFLNNSENIVEIRIFLCYSLLSQLLLKQSSTFLISIFKHNFLCLFYRNVAILFLALFGLLGITSSLHLESQQKLCETTQYSEEKI
jgi:hypothetical protein